MHPEPNHPAKGSIAIVLLVFGSAIYVPGFYLK